MEQRGGALQLIDAGGEAASFDVDLADTDSIAPLARDVLERFGEVDILMSVAPSA